MLVLHMERQRGLPVASVLSMIIHIGGARRQAVAGRHSRRCTSEPFGSQQCLCTNTCV